MSDDERLMAAAIALSRRGLGRTWPNPSVACLIVRDGALIGRSVTAVGGRPHAEPQALLEAGEAARGATAYVTLEPCSHFGRTPPCADALIKAGVSRVVAAMTDPDPRVAGNGLKRLRDAGIAVTAGVLEDAARESHAGHIARVVYGRPHVTLKIAASADGMIARRGERVAITGALANTAVHLMRASHDAVIVGASTAAIDDPLLTVRVPGLEGRTPLRIVLDTDATLSLGSRLVRSAHESPVHVVCGYGAPPERAQALEAMGAVVHRVSTNLYGNGLNLTVALRELVKLGLTRVMVEGGASLSQAFLERDLVDYLVLFRSPDVIGSHGVPALSSGSLRDELASPRFRQTRSIMRGRDTESHFKRSR